MLVPLTIEDVIDGPAAGVSQQRARPVLVAARGDLDGAEAGALGVGGRFGRRSRCVPCAPAALANATASAVNAIAKIKLASSKLIIGWCAPFWLAVADEQAIGSRQRTGPWLTLMWGCV